MGAAAVVGAMAGLGRSLALADPAPALASAGLRGALGWWLVAGPVLALVVAWRLAGTRELGLAQQRWASGETHLRLAGRAAITATSELARATPAALAGAVVAAAAMRLRAGGGEVHGLDVVVGRGAPGWAFVVGAVVAPVLGAGAGVGLGLAAATRRQVAAGALVALAATVSVLALRPWVEAADHLAPFTPLGGLWPVTRGWSLSRWFAVATAPGRRLAGIALWSGVIVGAARRRHRDGAARRQTTARR